MPNWVPSPDHIDKFKQAVNLLTAKRVSAMETGFPLNLEQVQLITRPPELAKLMALGLDSLNTTNWICFEVGPQHGAGRRSIVQIHFERPQHYAYNRQTRGRFIEDKPIYYNDGLDPEVRTKLIEWVNRSVYERRLAMLTSIVVRDFMGHIPKISIYHIAARWPALKTVFPLVKPAYSSYGSPRNSDIWERRGQMLGRNIRRWGWPSHGPEAEWYVKNRRKMQLVEETILSCLTLPNPPPKPPLWAEISDWEKIDGQIV
jgi:hypothetical protein